jgi:AAA15 family ATPase/GTPase
MNFIGFDNYRIFNKETILNLRPITILTGPNSSGKSSVIKAVKLLKQNSLSVKILNDDMLNDSIRKLRKFDGGATRLPDKLEFAPDDYGHYLRNFKNILCNSNKNNTEITFSLPVSHIFKEEMIGKLTFAHSDIQSISGERESFKLFENTKEVLSLEECQGNIFFGIYVNFNWIADVLRNTVLPALSEFYNKLLIEADYGQYTHEGSNLTHLIEQLLMIPQESISDSNRISHLMGIINSDRWLDFDVSKPILPFYQMFLFENTEEKETVYLSDWYSKNAEMYANTKKNISKEIGFDITDILSKEQIKVVHEYFKVKELELFKFINKYKIIFPYQQFDNYDYAATWKGIILENRVLINNEVPEFETSDKTKELLLSFPLYNDLLFLFQSFRGKELKSIDTTNNDLLNLFIRRLSSESARLYAKQINQFEFYDSTRASQSLFYHQTLSPFEYSLLNDHFGIYGSMDENDELYHYEGLQRLGICDKFRIDKNELGYFMVSLIKDGIEMPLSDFGSGITKLFFLYLAIQSKLFHTLFIEEPETNLHPDLQSKLADLIVETTKNNFTQVVIETHSEYFIRKLQYLVATKEVESEKILINYFNPVSVRKKEEIVKEITILEDGSLSKDFGPGFFDEALNWKFELMKLKNLN